MKNTSDYMQNTTNFAAAPSGISASTVTAFIPKISNEFPVWSEHRMQTERLNLRPVTESDFIEYIELLSDPAVMRFIGSEAGVIPSFEEIAKLHRGAIQAWKTRGYGRWSMFDRETGEFVGFCGFRSEQGIPELLCAIHEKFWNKGIAEEAARECLKYGFEVFGFNHVKAFTRPQHARARRVLEKLMGEYLGKVDYHGVEGAAYLLKPNIYEILN
ncbi:MAG: GNAT family N-acetyltransferase [Acidobacteriota bacterium]|nr:GNAT family N-acetyltransferase [Acidobacteriota bacterium]